MKIAVVFPGIGYHADKPLLYYSKEIAAQCGLEVLCLRYKGQREGNVGGLPECAAAK